MQHFDYIVSLRIQNVERYILVREIYLIPVISFTQMSKAHGQKSAEKIFTVIYNPKTFA